GALIERVTGDTYASYVQRSVLHRAGLGATWCGSSAAPAGKLAKGYTHQGGRFATVGAPSLEQTFSSGALYSTVRDLVQWQTILARGSVIRPSTYERMTSA